MHIALPAGRQAAGRPAARMPQTLQEEQFGSAILLRACCFSQCSLGWRPPGCPKHHKDSCPECETIGFGTASRLDGRAVGSPAARNCPSPCLLGCRPPGSPAGRSGSDGCHCNTNVLAVQRRCLVICAAVELLCCNHGWGGCFRHATSIAAAIKY